MTSLRKKKKHKNYGTDLKKKLNLYLFAKLAVESMVMSLK